MKSKPSRNSLVLLRRITAILPMRYRCAALLFSTLMVFPFILLAMGASALFDGAVGALCTMRRWFGDVAALSRDAKLQELSSSVDTAHVRS